jgi:hypothetical protein
MPAPAAGLALLAALLAVCSPARGGAPFDVTYGLSISKSVEQLYQRVGGPVAYRIVVANGSPAARQATVVDDVPDTVLEVRWSGPAGEGTGPHVVVPVRLPAGASVTIVVEGTVAPVAAGGRIVNRASVEVPTRALPAGARLTSEPAVTTVSGRDLDWPDDPALRPSGRTPADISAPRWSPPSATPGR